jgi:hypothetical protein
VYFQEARKKPDVASLSTFLELAQVIHFAEYDACALFERHSLIGLKASLLDFVGARDMFSRFCPTYPLSPIGFPSLTTRSYPFIKQDAIFLTSSASIPSNSSAFYIPIEGDLLI